MKRLLAILLLLSGPALAQFSSTAHHVYAGPTLPAHCSAIAGDVFVINNTTPTQLYLCTATDTWTVAGGGGGISTCSSPLAAGTAGQVCVTGTSQYLCHTTGACTVAGDWTLVGPVAGPMTQATPNSAANTVSVSVGTSGTAFAKTPVTIDPSTGAMVLPAGATVTAPGGFSGGAIFSASGGESATPSAPATDTLVFNSTYHVPQFTVAGASTVSATEVVPTSCTNQLVSGIPSTGTPVCASVADAMLTGQVGLAHGGTNADLSTTGGATQFLAQNASHVVSARVIAAGDLPSNQTIRPIGWHFDGGGSALSATQTGCYRVPFAGAITGWHIDGDQAGTATFAVRSVAFASYTGTAGFSGYTDVTGGGTAPTVSSSAIATFANVTSWVTTVTANSEFCFQMTSPATFTWVNVVLDVAAN